MDNDSHFWLRIQIRIQRLPIASRDGGTKVLNGRGGFRCITRRAEAWAAQAYLAVRRSRTGQSATKLGAEDASAISARLSFYHCRSSITSPSGSLISPRFEGPKLTGGVDISTPLLLRYSTALSISSTSIAIIR